MPRQAPQGSGQPPISRSTTPLGRRPRSGGATWRPPCSQRDKRRCPHPWRRLMQPALMPLRPLLQPSSGSEGSKCTSAGLRCTSSCSSTLTAASAPFTPHTHWRRARGGFDYTKPCPMRPLLTSDCRFAMDHTHRSQLEHIAAIPAAPPSASRQGLSALMSPHLSPSPGGSGDPVDDYSKTWQLQPGDGELLAKYKRAKKLLQVGMWGRVNGRVNGRLEPHFYCGVSLPTVHPHPRRNCTRTRACGESWPARPSAPLCSRPRWARSAAQLRSPACWPTHRCGATLTGAHCNDLNSTLSPRQASSPSGVPLI